MMRWKGLFCLIYKFNKSAQSGYQKQHPLYDRTIDIKQTLGKEIFAYLSTQGYTSLHFSSP